MYYNGNKISSCNPIIIGICGKKGAGKSTVAEILQDHFLKTGKQCWRQSFAQPLRDMIEVLLAHKDYESSYILSPGLQAELKIKDFLPIRHLTALTGIGLNFSYRQAMQTLGTEWGRELDPDIWIKQLMSRLLHAYFNNGAKAFVTIIDDVRFENEVAFIKGNNGVILQVLDVFADLDAPADSHVSEHSLRDVNGIVITNYKTGKDDLVHEVNAKFFESSAFTDLF